jgi:hypothetical protein
VDRHIRISRTEPGSVRFNLQLPGNGGQAAHWGSLIARMASPQGKQQRFNCPAVEAGEPPSHPSATLRNPLLLTLVE